ncbi:nitroreductase family protein [Leuconostocaceae bacterium ESL0723]|nr:nitroreductase family protein [Leuconostocaceae bacterium ESL0723]
MSAFNDLQKKRRSIYALGDQVKQTPEELFGMVNEAIKDAPTAFNSQSVRAVTLTGDAHKKLWDMVLDTLRKVVKNPDVFETTEQKVNGSFKSGFGTVLYFTDMDVVHGLEEQFPSYKDNFYDWSEEAIGIALYSVWLTLTEADLGASIQHYNPLIDQAVAEAFDIPSNWKLRGEMPFGTIEAPAAPKDYMPDDERFKLFTK